MDKLFIVWSSGESEVAKKIEPIHTGEFFTNALKSDWRAVTF